MLSTNPRRFPVAEQESHLFGLNLRRMLYRQTVGSRAAYHVLYTITEEGEDGPLVKVIHIRHAAQKPLNRREARRIRENQ